MFSMDFFMNKICFFILIYNSLLTFTLMANQQEEKLIVDYYGEKKILLQKLIEEYNVNQTEQIKIVHDMFCPWLEVNNNLIIHIDDKIFEKIFSPYFKTKDDVIGNSISSFLNRVKNGEQANNQIVAITNATYLLFDIKHTETIKTGALFRIQPKKDTGEDLANSKFTVQDFLVTNIKDQYNYNDFIKDEFILEYQGIKTVVMPDQFTRIIPVFKLVKKVIYIPEDLLLEFNFLTPSNVEDTIGYFNFTPYEQTEYVKNINSLHNVSNYLKTSKAIQSKKLSIKEEQYLKNISTKTFCTNSRYLADITKNPLYSNFSNNLINYYLDKYISMAIDNIYQQGLRTFLVENHPDIIEKLNKDERFNAFEYSTTNYSLWINKFQELQDKNQQLQTKMETTDIFLDTAIQRKEVRFNSPQLLK